MITDRKVQIEVNIINGSGIRGPHFEFCLRAEVARADGGRGKWPFTNYPSNYLTTYIYIYIYVYIYIYIYI